MRVCSRWISWCKLDFFHILKSSGCVSAVQVLFSVLSSKCRFSLGLNGSFSLFRNNPAWEKPACKHETVTKCANWFVRKKAPAVKLFTRGISPGSVSVCHTDLRSPSHLWMGSFHGGGEKPQRQKHNMSPLGLFLFCPSFHTIGQSLSVVGGSCAYRGRIGQISYGLLLTMLCQSLL